MDFYQDDRDPRGTPTPVDSVLYDIAGWNPESIRATATDLVEAARDGRKPCLTAPDSSTS